MKNIYRLIFLSSLAIIVLSTSCNQNKPVTLTIMEDSEVSEVMATTAVVKGTTLEIGENMQVYGHVWGETEKPDISSNLKSEHKDAEAGSFTDELKDLKPETKYYLRAYAKDGDEVIYKDAVSFTTLKDIQSIGIITDDISNVNYTTATCGGNVINEGESSVTARGICWSTSEDPTVDDSSIGNGSGIGAFSNNIENLSDNTTYYIRAYATNTEGTVYGEQKIFTTIKLPVIGDFYAGGIVFYFDNETETGLVCAVNNQDHGNDAPWGCGNTEITGARGIAIGTGLQNTEAIEVACTSFGTAADLCARSDLNEYTDWFLPSKDELDSMYVNKLTIDETATANGGVVFEAGEYWSSSEFGATDAWSQNFSNGNNDNYSKKVNTFYVRAVRAF